MSAVTCLRAAVPAGTVARWLHAIDRSPAWAARSGPGFEPRSSSLRAAACAEADLEGLARTLRHGPLAALCSARWGDAGVALAVDACWVRRQYAPAAAPAGHAPHAWHQDGALGARFDVPPDDDAARLLDLVTCWIALVPCGADAPGLELADSIDGDRRLDLHALADLAHGVAAGRLETSRPVLAAGDALVFDGRVPHRTHVAAAMHADRTSLELRFVRDEGRDHAPRIGRLRTID